MLKRDRPKAAAITKKRGWGRWSQVRVLALTLPMVLPVCSSSSTLAEKPGQFPLSPKLSGIVASPQLLAQKERRTALVIGNGAYGAEGKLNNPPNDAADVDQALRKLGFEVTLLQNVDKRKMEGAIKQFNRQLRNGNTSDNFWWRW